jgi:hypothetical protein
MVLIWALLGVLVGYSGVRYRQRLRALREPASPVIDDDAIDRIIREGKLADPEEERRADRKAAAEAEEEFWDEYWDEPDEYQP